MRAGEEERGLEKRCEGWGKRREGWKRGVRAGEEERGLGKRCEAGDTHILTYTHIHTCMYFVCE